MSFFQQKDSFSSKFVSLLSVMRDNFPVLFQQKLYMLLTKIAYQNASFETVTVFMKINQIPFVIFKPGVSFPSCFASPFIVMTHNSSEIFYLKHYMLKTKKTHQSTHFQTSDWFNESSPNSSCHF